MARDRYTQAQGQTNPYPLVYDINPQDPARVQR
jgi:hypothetical protein